MEGPLTLEKQADVAVIWIDTPGEEWNKITLETEAVFSKIIDEIDVDPNIKASVLISRKKGFIAGADIEQFLKMKPGEAVKTAQAGHLMLNRIEDSQKPYVAAIHGACMGGGLELSLACAGRVVSDDSSTVLALPEVKLGLLPGLGGTRRLPKTVGIQKGLDAILTGKNLYAHRAHKIGLADEIVDQTELLTVAKRLALRIGDGKFKRRDKRSLVEKILEGNPITKKIIFSKARQIAIAKSYGNYPAVSKIIESIRYGSSHNRELSSKNETQLFDELLSSPEAFQLINIFFGMNALRKNPKIALAKPINLIAVLGAGLMGEGIAEVSLNVGMGVLIKDIDEKMLTKAKNNIWKSLSKKVKNKALDLSQAETQINAAGTTLNYEGFEKSNVVIEAVFEDLELKHKVLRDTEDQIGKDCVFASNTSSLPITKIAHQAKRPENVVGMHYFSPVPKMPLLEIIVTPKTADWVTATALEVGVRQGKVCIVVNDGPGFYTTRILAPYMNEALLMLEEGGDILQMDRAMKRFGFPVGPFTLMDEVGIDVGAHINRGELGKMFADRGGEASTLMEKLSGIDFKGRKNKKGFLVYDDGGERVKGKTNPEIKQFISAPTRAFSDEEIQERLSLMMINEAAYCLQEKIIQSPRDGDIGAVFGLGFPPFRGGPFRYMDSIGASSIVGRMNDYLLKLGDRFKLAQILNDYSDSNRAFYPIE